MTRGRPATVKVPTATIRSPLIATSAVRRGDPAAAGKHALHRGHAAGAAAGLVRFRPSRAEGLPDVLAAHGADRVLVVRDALLECLLDIRRQIGEVVLDAVETQVEALLARGLLGLHDALAVDPVLMGEGAGEGGARVSSDEAEVRICEAALSRTEEECHPTVRGVCAGEPVSAAEKTVASGTGLTRERRLQITSEPPKRAEDHEKTDSELLYWHGRTLTTPKSRAYSEFP